MNRRAILSKANIRLRHGTVGGLVAMLTGIVSVSFFSELRGQDPSPVRASRVSKQVVQTSQTFSGTVTPIRKAIIGSAVEGRVEDVMVEQGDYVHPIFPSDSTANDRSPEAQRTIAKQGYPLAQLQIETIDIEISAARAELENRAAALRELQASLPADLQLTRAALKNAESQLDLAQRHFDRVQSLVSSGRLASDSEVEESQSALFAAELAYAKAKSDFRRLEDTTESRMAQAEALVQVQSETIRLLEDRKAKFTVRAPFAGVISTRFAEVGQWLSVGASVAEVVQMNPIDVIIQVPQGVVQDFKLAMLRASESQEVSSGQAQKAPNLTADIVLGSNLNPISGQVIALVPTADLLSRSFPVKIRVENPQSLLGFMLKPGMLVQVRVAVGDSQEKLLVDKDALVINNEGKFLALLDRTSEPIRVKMVPVGVGEAYESKIEVFGDLRENDWVVVEGNERLRTGQQVAILNAAGLETSLMESQSALRSETVPTSIETPSGSIAN
jgi:HlyD family secretion protein